MKYVIYQRNYCGMKQEIPIIFPNQLVHLDVARVLSKVIGSSKIIAAGEFSSMDIGGERFGGTSTSIGIGSRGKMDAAVISNFDYFQGLS